MFPTRARVVVLSLLLAATLPYAVLITYGPCNVDSSWAAYLLPRCYYPADTLVSSAPVAVANGTTSALALTTVPAHAHTVVLPGTSVIPTLSPSLVAAMPSRFAVTLILLFAHLVVYFLLLFVLIPLDDRRAARRLRRLVRAVLCCTRLCPLGRPIANCFLGVGGAGGSGNAGNKARNGAGGAGGKGAHASLRPSSSADQPDDEAANDDGDDDDASSNDDRDDDAVERGASKQFSRRQLLERGGSGGGGGGGGGASGSIGADLAAATAGEPSRSSKGGYRGEPSLSRSVFSRIVRSSSAKQLRERELELQKVEQSEREKALQQEHEKKRLDLAHASALAGGSKRTLHERDPSSPLSPPLRLAQSRLQQGVAAPRYAADSYRSSAGMSVGANSVLGAAGAAAAAAAEDDEVDELSEFETTPHPNHHALPRVRNGSGASGTSVSSSVASSASRMAANARPAAAAPPPWRLDVSAFALTATGVDSFDSILTSAYAPMTAMVQLHNRFYETTAALEGVAAALAMRVRPDIPLSEITARVAIGMLRARVEKRSFGEHTLVLRTEPIDGHDVRLQVAPIEVDAGATPANTNDAAGASTASATPAVLTHTVRRPSGTLAQQNGNTTLDDDNYSEDTNTTLTETVAAPRMNISFDGDTEALLRAARTAVAANADVRVQAPLLVQQLWAVAQSSQPFLDHLRAASSAPSAAIALPPAATIAQVEAAVLRSRRTIEDALSVLRSLQFAAQTRMNQLQEVLEVRTKGDDAHRPVSPPPFIGGSSGGGGAGSLDASGDAAPASPLGLDAREFERNERIRRQRRREQAALDASHPSAASSTRSRAAGTGAPTPSTAGHTPVGSALLPPLSASAAGAAHRRRGLSDHGSIVSSASSGASSVHLLLPPAAVRTHTHLHTHGGATGAAAASFTPLSQDAHSIPESSSLAEVARAYAMIGHSRESILAAATSPAGSTASSSAAARRDARSLDAFQSGAAAAVGAAHSVIDEENLDQLDELHHEQVAARNRRRPAAGAGATRSVAAETDGDDTTRSGHTSTRQTPLSARSGRQVEGAASPTTTPPASPPLHTQGRSLTDSAIGAAAAVAASTTAAIARGTHQPHQSAASRAAAASLRPSLSVASSSGARSSGKENGVSLASGAPVGGNARVLPRGQTLDELARAVSERGGAAPVAAVKPHSGAASAAIGISASASVTANPTPSSSIGPAAAAAAAAAAPSAVRTAPSSPSVASDAPSGRRRVPREPQVFRFGQ